MNDQQLRFFRELFDKTPDSVVDAVLLVIGAWAVTYLAGWLIAWLMQGKKQQLEQAQPREEGVIQNPKRGFDDGGAVIGRLERFLIYLFVLAGEPSAVGFLIAAKSVFRFGELSDQQNRLEAEYITIGTLMSFSVGLAIAVAVRWLTNVL